MQEPTTLINRTIILNSLKQRNIKEKETFYDLIKSQNRLFEANIALKNEITELKITNQKLQQENIELLKTPSSFSQSNAYPHEKLRLLDEQLLRAKDEVISLQKSLVDQSQQVISLNKQLKDKNDEMTAKDIKLAEAENKYEALKNTNKELENRIALNEESLKLWRDEKVETEMQYNCLLQKYDKLKDDYQQILTASLRFREEQIEKINKQNELDNERLHHKMRDELEKAREEPVTMTPSAQMISVAPINFNFKTQFNMPLVNRAVFKFDAHEGEINAVKYHRSGKYFATGGGDRKIKLWEYKDGKCEMINSLIGSNAAIASIDIDNENSLIAGTSFDFACRLWSLNEHRLRMSSGDLQPTHTLTGHTNKVLTGKFLGVMKIVTGSYDRTLKIWDLMQKACIKTLFAGSSCNDLVTLDSQLIISGHLDRKIRFWDARADPTQSEILLQGKITSLDVSSNRSYLLACIRDENALKMIDIRMNKVTETFCSEDFKVSYDWARAIFSPDVDHQYVSAGSADGNVIIWNSATGKVEKTLKEHNSAVIALSWHPQGNYLVTGDAKKKAIIWSYA